MVTNSGAAMKQIMKAYGHWHAEATTIERDDGLTLAITTDPGARN